MCAALTLWEEYAREPVRLGLPMPDPAIDHGATKDEVLHPATQGLEGRVRRTLPHVWHVVDDERMVHHL